MGLAIFALAVVGDGYESSEENLWLSRTFCNLMWLYSNGGVDSELGQIGFLTGVDVTPLGEMDNYMTDEEIAERLSYSEPTEHAAVFEKAVQARASVVGNLPRIENLLSQLIQKLSFLEEVLPGLLSPIFPEDHLNIRNYFANSNLEMDNSYYLDNNFGRDLRSLKAFVNQAKSVGSQTVFFNYRESLTSDYY